MIGVDEKKHLNLFPNQVVNEKKNNDLLMEISGGSISETRKLIQLRSHENSSTPRPGGKILAGGIMTGFCAAHQQMWNSMSITAALRISSARYLGFNQSERASLGRMTGIRS